jgi:ribulose-phosphate 3-epimerase
MATDNEFFIKELIKIGVQSITFHYESAFHVERMIQLIKASGIKVGIALNSATSLHVLDYVIDSCEYILLMLISPGYAGNKNEAMVPYALKKIKECKELIKQRELSTKIIVDGRVSIQTIPDIVAAGADYLVAGSTSLFMKEHTISENYVAMNEQIEKGLAVRLNSTRSA